MNEVEFSHADPQNELPLLPAEPLLYGSRCFEIIFPSSLFIQLCWVLFWVPIQHRGPVHTISLLPLP